VSGIPHLPLFSPASPAFPCTCRSAPACPFSEISDLKNFGPDGRYECDEKLFREEEAGYRLYDLAHKIDGTQFEQQILEALLEQGVIGEKRESEDEESEDG